MSGKKMKVLWFEVTEPSRYNPNGLPIGRWQDALERILRAEKGIELIVSFVSSHFAEVKCIDGVTYHPIHFSPYTFKERNFQKYWDVYVRKMLPTAIEIINNYKPDIIHVFGTEWPFAQIAKHTTIPIVVHIQGSIVPYNKALYPPGYSVVDEIWQVKSLRKWWRLWKRQRDDKNREEWERSTWNCVQYYMGRTNWDKALADIMHPGCNYFHVEEALRPTFLNIKKEWSSIKDNSKIRLVSTGCSSFWKGPDMMLKVAKILTELKVDFEWNVAGSMPLRLRNIVERKEKARFTDCHINVLGFIGEEELCNLLLMSNLYIHTAYIENSPNSICEAQCAGIPIISTNVGGISSLIENGIDGILVPANNPWQMASAIIKLSNNMSLLSEYSKKSKEKAILRHNENIIKDQLISCYSQIIKTWSYARN